MRRPDPRSRRQRWSTAILGGGLVLGFWLHSRAWTFLCDDAFISFRYAVNLAREGALEYNLGERVEGYTNFLWVLILALGEGLGLAPPLLAPALTMIGAACLVVAATLLLRGLRGRSGAPPGPGDLAPAALMVASPEVMVWSQGGLETSAAAALAVLAMVAWIGRRPIVASLVAGLAGLLRADVLLAVACFGLAWLALRGAARLGWVRRGLAWAGTEDERRSAPGSRRGEEASEPPGLLLGLGVRRLVVAGLLFVALIGGHLIFRRLYYGVWLPNTWAIKSHGALLRGTHGVAYLEAWASGLGLVSLSGLAALMIAGFAVLRTRALVLVSPIAGTALYAWSVGGDFMAYSRFLLVASALIAVLLSWILIDLGELVGRRFPGLRALGWVVVLGLAGLLGVRSQGRWAADMEQSAGWLDGRWEGVRAMDHFALERLHAGAWMGENLPPETLITVGAAGALPYASMLPTIDAYGLVDPAIARLPGVKPLVGERARPGHQIGAPLSYLRERDPDLFCHVGFVGPRRPTPAQARRRGLGGGFVWACVEPDPVAHPREPGGIVGGNYYCCLRPRARRVGPFGG